MDYYASKRAANGRVFSRKAVVLRDMANNGDQDAQVCNRAGFGSRFKKKGKQLESSDKAKTSKSSLCSSKGKEISGSSSRAFSSNRKPGKLSSEPRKKLSSHVETGVCKVSSIHEEPEATKLTPSPVEIQKGLELETGISESKTGVSMTMESSSVALNTRSKKNLNKKPGVANQLSIRGSSFPFASKSSAHITCYPTRTFGLKNLKCNSVSNTGPFSRSSSVSSLSNGKGSVKKRLSEGESSSSAQGKKRGGSSSFRQNPSPNLSTSISETRRHRTSIANREDYSSTKTQQPFSSSRARVSNQGTLNKTSTNDTPSLVMPICQSEGPNHTNSHRSSNQVSLETSNRASSNSGPNAGGLRAMISIASADISSVHSPLSRDSFRDYNIDGIEEVLLELQRIRHEAELTYEQLLQMDSYLSLSGLNFYDQHRDMRLDIDSMSYEELLALEERMGTVSTALSEEALLKCLKRCTYQLSSENESGCAGGEGDVKCSICQEEYVAGDEVGRLLCEHGYHVQCIQQWLRLKNWCPICKASAESS